MFEKLSQFLSREPQNQQQLVDMLRHAQQRELIDFDALQMIEGVLQVSDKQVRDIMVPRPQMIIIEADATPDSVMPEIIQSRHSRFPVIGDNRDKVLGILLAKDLLPSAIQKTTEKIHIRDLIRPATFIPESKHLDVLLKEFRLNRNHMAIVVDEYGCAAGLVTIEDVLEEIVGDIEDEYDISEKKQLIKDAGNNEYFINAQTPIDVFNDYFDTHFSNEDFDTIGGLVLQKFGFLPKHNDTTELNQFKFTVIKANQRGIKLLKLKIIRNK